VKNKQISRILAPIMTSMLTLGTMIIVCSCFLNSNFAFAEYTYCLFISIVYFPLFMLTIYNFEITVLCVLITILILAILFVYLYLAWSAYIKPSKIKYGILILLLVIDIVGTFAVFMFSFMIGLINVCFKIAIILCYVKNMRLYDE
jgi:hypothetical protein